MTACWGNNCGEKGLLQNRPFLFLFPCCSLARLASTLRWAQFLPMRNWGKNRLGRSPLRPPLGYDAGTASSVWSALVWCQFRKAVAPCKVRSQASRALPPLQGLSWACCSRFRLPEAWVSAAGNSRNARGRPGHGNCPAVGPAAMKTWCGGITRSSRRRSGPWVARRTAP